MTMLCRFPSIEQSDKVQRIHVVRHSPGLLGKDGRVALRFTEFAIVLEFEPQAQGRREIVLAADAPKEAEAPLGGRGNRRRRGKSAAGERRTLSPVERHAEASCEGETAPAQRNPAQAGGSPGSRLVVHFGLTEANRSGVVDIGELS